MAELAIPLAMILAENLHVKLRRPSNAKEEVERAQRILTKMKNHLRGNSSDSDQSRSKEIQHTVYDVEDALSQFIVTDPPHVHSNRASAILHEFRYKVPVWRASREFSKNLKKIEKEMVFDSKVLEPVLGPQISTPALAEDINNLRFHQVIEEDEIVGFEEPKEKLINQLLQGHNSRPLKIWIVGPAGSGKTTLAGIVYEDRKVQRFFDCHAFGCVPRLFDSRTFFQHLLSQFEAPIFQVPAVVHVDPRMRLRQLLEGKRYLLVLDNVLSANDLECIVNALPNGLPGSKLIMTSCNSDLALGDSDYIHDLSNGLSSDEANKLFCKKAFHGDCDKCPPEIEKLAEMIINRCGGLPLAISASGTFLAQKPQIIAEWERFNNRLGSDHQIISRIWQPSYIDLPSHLQFCFLYFGMFPEDYSIKREKLIRLWVAEGFVREGRGATMEEDADCYLNELIGRNLVHVSSKEIDGQVRSCRALNNLVRQFIISKPENFVTVLEANSTGTPTCSTNSGEIIRRLSAHYVPINNFSSRGRDLNRTRTLLVFFSSGQQPEILSHTYELGKVLKTLETLRVLDLKGVPLEHFPKSIFGLTLLKYISMRKTKIKEVPSSIKKLTQLETLDLKRTQVTALPKEIYELYNMRHLLVSNGACDNDDGPVKGVEVAEGNIGALKLDGNIGALKDALQKLSLIKVGNNRTILRELGELIRLRKLALTDLKQEHGRELCRSIEKMEHLLTLELRSTSENECLDLERMKSPPSSLRRLSLKGRLISLPQWIPMLQSVVKIGLKLSKLNADISNPLKPLQDLPNLMELDLVHYYTGRELVFEVGTFKKLKILRIEHFDELNTMSVKRSAMPELKKLTISKCEKLEFPRVGFGGLAKLHELLLHDMRDEFIADIQNQRYHQAIARIPVIHSVNHGRFQNLSSGERQY